ncbi:hypothetical protein [Streptomyces adelaidensis]|uniref:hypothetical protein n=1 Tax=Streptomyces adelaidensis TaxID=2796465 RepID=UPI0019059F72|nr:hypothetical protein [Streptomyces adelaidensis]
MVLDSDMDHSRGVWGIQRDRAETLECAFGEFADWCARTASRTCTAVMCAPFYDSLYRGGAPRGTG